MKIETGILAMPAELRNYVLNTCVSASPYNRYASGSFYSKEGKTWNNTPDNIIRVSDHWNFYSQGSYHCITDVPNNKLTGWVVAKYNASNEIYEVISIDVKDFTALELHNKRTEAKNFADFLEVKKKTRIERLYNICKKRKDSERAKKIKNKKIWVQLEHNLWRKGKGQRYNFQGIEIVTGLLIWESKGTAIIVEVNGVRREFRKYDNYKELTRKPYTRIRS